MSETPARTLHLFEGYGIELEYMIVDRQTLAVRPICDQVLALLAGGETVNEVSLGRIDVSNELVMHVIEFKCNGPQPDLVRMSRSFQEQIHRINEILADRWDAQLLPTAMHPLMKPLEETRLWPHGQQKIYQTYDRIFNCRGHGWSNLQSIHINLPFHGDEEFGKLHAAIRLVLPLLPGLAASSPIVEGRVTGKADNRLDFYSQNQKRIGSIIGQIIPEKVFTQADYQRVVYDNIKRDIAPHDPDEVLEEEWLNSRGAIARFDRDAIEIRLLDIQESVAADFAVISLVVSLVKSLVDEKWLALSEQKKIDEAGLREVLMGAIAAGEAYRIEHPGLLACFKQKVPINLGRLWRSLAEELIHCEYQVRDFAENVKVILEKGTLSTRMKEQLGAEPSREAIVETYRELGACLDAGKIYG